MGSNSSREIITTRVLNFPKETVFKAWADPVHLAHWWGPEGFKNIFHEFDFRPGGKWRFVMQGPDGRNYDNESEFLETSNGERIVFRHLSDPKFTVTANFEELNEKRSKLTWTMLFDSAKVCESLKSIVIPANEQNMVRLEAELNKMASGAVFSLSRKLSAPRELVFDACTNPDRMQQWWGPKGVNVVASKMDFRAGGSYLYGMSTPDGKTIWGKFAYREIEKPARLLFVNSFSDENGGVTRHPFAENWPLELLSTFMFYKQGDETAFTIRWEPLNPTATEFKAFADGHASMHQGWSGTLDELTQYLKKV